MILVRILILLLLIGTGASLGGCGWMPANGPAGDDVRWGGHDNESLPYELVKVTPQVERVMALNAPRLGAMFRDTKPPRGITFGINDVLSFTFFEPAGAGFFIPSEAGFLPVIFAPIPNQPIDTDANITSPYAG